MAPLNCDSQCCAEDILTSLTAPVLTACVALNAPLPTTSTTTMSTSNHISRYSIRTCRVEQLAGRSQMAFHLLNRPH